MQSLELFFDYTCPFAYLGVSQAPAMAARLGVTLTYRPVLLGGVFKAHGTPQNLAGTLGPAKAAHNLNDMQRWARRFGKTLVMPPNHPMRSVEALRATLATGLDPAIIARFYEAYWVHGREISQPDVIEDVIGRPIPDLEAFKDDLRVRTEEAVARGVFGVPTFVVDGTELYWGQDRMALIEGKEPTLPTRGPASVELFWDFASPFAYLAAERIERVAAHAGTKLTWSPVFVGGLFKAVGMASVPLATFSQAKQQYLLRDMERAAAYAGVSFRFPSRFPMNSLSALRCWLALPAEKRTAFLHTVFRAYWAEDTNIADETWLGDLVGADVLAKSKSEDVKAALRASTERAIAKGAFGVPTMIADDNELYFGQDRLEMAFNG